MFTNLAQLLCAPHLQKKAPVVTGEEQEDTQALIRRIINKPFSSTSEIESFLSSHPKLNFTASQAFLDTFESGPSLHTAVMNQNVELVEYLISKFGKTILFKNDPHNRSIIRTAVKHAPNSLNSSLPILIKAGANVNTPSIFITSDAHYGPIEEFTTPLDLAIDHWQYHPDKTAARMLLQAGAQPGIYFTISGLFLLKAAQSRPNHLNRINAFASILPRQGFAVRNIKEVELLQKEVDNIYFQFFIGLKDTSSPLYTLPKELIVKILTDYRHDSFTKKASAVIQQARYDIFKNEMLFLCALEDQSSCIASLNPDLVRTILKTRILHQQQNG